MEKNRFVLEHKIENLKQQILPKDELIKELRSQIDAMEDELISVTKVQAELGKSNYYCLKVSWFYVIPTPVHCSGTPFKGHQQDYYCKQKTQFQTQSATCWLIYVLE